MANNDDFQAKMLKYIKYGLSIQTKEAEGTAYYIVTIKFKPTWSVIGPAEDTGVHCLPSTEENGVYSYFSEVSRGVTAIFEAIEETINYNEDVEQKLSLLKVKINELQEIFATRTFGDLLNLKFVIEETKEKPKKTKKTNTSSKKISKEEEKEEVKDKILKEENPQDMVTEEPTKKNNTDEANEIDKKIALALGKK